MTKAEMIEKLMAKGVDSERAESISKMSNCSLLEESRELGKQHAKAMIKIAREIYESKVEQSTTPGLKIQWLEGKPLNPDLGSVDSVER